MVGERARPERMGAYCWRRLLVITSEDVGIAWTKGPSVIHAFHGSWKSEGKKRWARTRGRGQACCSWCRR